jgi:hypothetical protein
MHETSNAFLAIIQRLWLVADLNPLVGIQIEIDRHKYHTRFEFANYKAGGVAQICSIIKPIAVISELVCDHGIPKSLCSLTMPAVPITDSTFVPCVVFEQGTAKTYP